MELIRSSDIDHADALLPGQPRAIPPYDKDPRSGPAAQEDLPGQYWKQLWRIKWIVAGCAAAGVGVALFIASLQTPIYRARVSLELQSLNQNYLDMRSIDPNAGTDNLETFLQTQIQLLGSDSLLQRTVEKVQESNPTVITSPTPKSVNLGPLTAKPKVEKTVDAAWRIAKNLKVKGSGITRLVEIIAESPHPALAADFANTLAEQYTEQTLENRWDSTRRTGEWLSRKVNELKGKLQAAEEKLQAYSRSSGLVYTSEKENVSMEQLRRLELELSTAHMDRVQKQARYEQVQNTAPGSLPEVMESSEFHETRVKLSDLRRELADASTTMTPEHQKVQKLKAQIDSLTGELENQRGNVLRRMKNDFEAAQRRERLLYDADLQQRRVVSDQNTKETQYNLLKRDVDSTRMMYDSMQQKLKEVGVASAMPMSNVRVVDAAKPATIPAYPSKSLNTALGLIVGSLAGLVLGLFRVQSNEFFRTPGEAGKLLAVPEIGAVPALSCDPTRPTGRFLRLIGAGGDADPRRVNQLANSVGNGAPKRNAAVDLTLVCRDNSVMAEAYRAALPAILFANSQGSVRTLVVTSASPREGKTSTISNLAIGLAELNKRVLLIDGDVRNPRLHEVFGISNDFGLADLLEQPQPYTSGGPIDSGVDRLHVLPVGQATPRTKNLLHSPKLIELLVAFEAQYDIVLIDTAPVLLMRDARLLGSLADAVILVVRAGQTSRAAAMTVVSKFRQDKTPVLGLILNDWKPGSTDSVYGKDYFNGYRHYYRS
jgi:capsular exopolysaccharide synthesis family protein